MRKADEVASTLEEMKLVAAAKTVREGVVETLAYTNFPMPHWVRIRTNNAIERLNREIRRRQRAWWAPSPTAIRHLCWSRPDANT